MAELSLLAKVVGCGFMLFMAVTAAFILFAVLTARDEPPDHYDLYLIERFHDDSKVETWNEYVDNLFKEIKDDDNNT